MGYFLAELDSYRICELLLLIAILRSKAYLD